MIARFGEQIEMGEVQMASVTDVSSTTVHQAVGDALLSSGIDAAFGLMGEDTANFITDFDRIGLQYYAAFHENVAVTMASAYAWASDGIGVVVISRGPGMTNAMSALAASVAERRRLLVITGEAALGARRGVDSKARVPQAAVAAAAGLEYYTASSPAEVLDALATATASASDGRPAVLAIPIDLLDQPMPSDGRVAVSTTPNSRGITPERDRAPAPETSDIDAVVQLLTESQRPLVLAGRGAVRAGAHAQLVALAQRTGAWLGTSLMAKDLFAGNPYDFGLVGGCTSARGRSLLADIDCVLVFGASLNVFTTAAGTLFPEVPVVQVDIDPNSAQRSFLPVRSVTADAGLTAEALLAALGPDTGEEHPLHDPASLGQLDGLEDFVGTDDSTATAIDPRVLTAQLDEMLPKNRTVLSDGGHMNGFPMMHMHVPGPDHYLLAVMGISAIGMGLGSALGVAIGRPEEDAVLVIGDGTLAMTMGDLATVARYALPLVIVVLNDQSYGAERHFLDLHGKPNDRSLHPDIDFAAVAAALGIESATVRTVDDLRAQAASLADIRVKPLLLDCKITPTRSEWIEEIA
jgi:acetolactate synthase-1/2/3 large subunit